MIVDRLRFTETTWRGLPAWRIGGLALDLVLTRVGAQLASLTIPGDRLNPYWQPTWPARSPDQAGEAYGSKDEAPLLACICGHNLCLDRFGPPWPNDPRPLHGEAGVVAWEARRVSSRLVVASADLPIAGLHIERHIQLRGPTLLLRTLVRHGDAEPKPIEWAEHATLGDPFLANAAITACVDAAWNWPRERQSRSRFPAVEPGGAVPVEKALAMPTVIAPPCGDIVTCRVATGFWRVERRDLGRRLEYRWSAEEFPWLCLWTEHRGRDQAPWKGRVRARGMEFSTKPFPEGQPPGERAEAFQGRPCTCLVPPGDGLTRTIAIRWDRI